MSNKNKSKNRIAGVNKTSFGTVSNTCARLNIRSEAKVDDNIVCVVKTGETLEVDYSKSNDSWVYVTTAFGITGYAMKKFIDFPTQE